LLDTKLYKVFILSTYIYMDRCTMSIKNETFVCHMDFITKFYLEGALHEVYSIKFLIIGSFVQGKGSLIYFFTNKVYLTGNLEFLRKFALY
jgi:hypothetical protein